MAIVSKPLTQENWATLKQAILDIVGDKISIGTHKLTSLVYNYLSSTETIEHNEQIPIYKTDPEAGEYITDPETGEYIQETDPETGEPLFEERIWTETKNIPPPFGFSGDHIEQAVEDLINEGVLIRH